MGSKLQQMAWWLVDASYGQDSITNCFTEWIREESNSLWHGSKTRY